MLKQAINFPSPPARSYPTEPSVEIQPNILAFGVAVTFLPQPELYLHHLYCNIGRYTELLLFPFVVCLIWLWMVALRLPRNNS